MSICKCGLPAVNAGKCREHYNEYMRGYNLRRYYRLKEKALAHLGGSCVNCGSEEDLEFDHVDPSTKEFDIARGITWAWHRVEAELDKCQLLCKTCHVAKGHENADQRQVPHGGGVSGKRNCPCSPCKMRKAEYMKSRSY